MKSTEKININEEVTTKFIELENALLSLKNKYIKENRSTEYTNILVVIVSRLEDLKIKDPNFVDEGPYITE